MGPQPTHERTLGCLPPPRPSTQPALDRIQMMTGTAAATFPISSSVCMIFLIRAWGGRGEVGPRSLCPRKGCWGKREGYPGRKGAGGTDAGRARKGAGRPGPRTPRCARPTSRAWARASGELHPLLPGHVLTGGNRALYFFFLLGISGTLSPRRAQHRRQQPPGPGACSPPARRGSPGSWCRPLRPPQLPTGS